MDVKKYDAELPTEKSVPSNNLSDYTILLYGQEKIGKTSFAAQFPDAMFLFFEPGGKDLAVYKKEIDNWSHFRLILANLEKDTRYKNIIFDTADVAHAMCSKWSCEKLGIDDPEEAEFGKGWRKIRTEFASAVLRLTKTGKGVIFLSHGTEKQTKIRGEKVDRTVPTMPKQAREILEALVDVWVYYRYTDARGGREFVIRGNEVISAGTRARSHFIGIDRIPAGKDEKQAYQNFVAAFENKLTTGQKHEAPAPVAVAPKAPAKFKLKQP